MHTIKRQIRELIQRALLLFFLVITFQLLSCLPKYDNPVSFNYQGDYKLNLTQRLPSNLEILKPYTASFENAGSDSYWKVYPSSNSIKTIFHAIQDTPTARFTNTPNKTFTIIFTDTISKGKIYFTAERQNSTKELYRISDDSLINVTNPYKIVGNNFAGMNDTVCLHIEYNGARINAPNDSISVVWDGNIPKSLSESFTIKNLSDTKNIGAVLKFSNDSFQLAQHTIAVNGYSPEIDAFYQNYTLTLGTTASFSVTCHDDDKDNDSIHYIIIGEHNSHNDTLLDIKMPYDPGKRSLEIDTIKDTSYSAIRLTIVDANHLEDTTTLVDKQVSYPNPNVKFNQNDSTPAIGDSITLYVTPNSADTFFWQHGQIFDTTTTNSLKLPPFTTTAEDTVFVYAKKVIRFSDTSFNFIGIKDSIILKPRSYEYRIAAKVFPDTIKTKAWTFFQCVVVRGTDTLSNDSVRYKWEFSKASDSITYPNLDTNGSKVNIKLNDSIPPFIVTVNAVYLQDSSVDIKLFTRTLIVRSFSPSFKFIQAIPGNTVLNYTMAYTADDNPGTGGHVSKIYFKQISSPAHPLDSINNGDPMNITFNKSGEITVEGWAVDDEGNSSKHATLTFNISITTPLFAQSFVRKYASTNETVYLNAALVSSIPNATFFWDKDNNGTWEKSTKSSQDSVKFDNEGIDTVKVQCKSQIGDSTTMVFCIVVKKNAPVIDSFRVKDSNYINKPDTFYVKGHDLDSNLKALYLFRFKSATDSLLIDSIVYKVPQDTVDTLFIDSLSIAGTYLYSVHIKDSNKNTTPSEKKSVVIKQGLPTIKSVMRDSTYIYDTTELTIEPYDNDINSQSTFTYYISYDDTTHFNDSTVTGSIWKFNHIFKNSGTNYFFIKVKDHDKQISLIHKDSIYVNLDAPTIKAITIDNDIYINKTVKFTVQATDLRGTVDSVCADWNSDDSRDTTVVLSDSKNSYLFSHSFPKDQAGERHIRFWAFDNYKNKSIIRDTVITIHKAPPVLDSIRSDSTHFWAKDLIPFSFFCNDTNGSIKKVVIDWGDGSSKTDTSLNVSNYNVKINAIHNYSIARDSTYHRSVLLTDNDANESLFTDTVHVSSGMPQVWIPGGGDTLFTPIGINGGEFTLTVNSKDSNDSNLKYYWVMNSSILDTSVYELTYVPSKVINVTGAGFVNKVYGTYQSAVFVKDHDGNMAGDSFYVYLDGPPPAPTIVYPISNNTIYSDQSVVFEWYGTDVHDSINTRYRISILPPGDNSAEKEILKFTDNSSVTNELINGIFHFRFQYNPTEGFGAYRWKVEAQDISNSTTSSQQQPFSFQQR